MLQIWDLVKILPDLILPLLASVKLFSRWDTKGAGIGLIFGFALPFVITGAAYSISAAFPLIAFSEAVAAVEAVIFGISTFQALRAFQHATTRREKEAILFSLAVGTLFYGYGVYWARTSPALQVYNSVPPEEAALIIGSRQALQKAYPDAPDCWDCTGYSKKVLELNGNQGKTVSIFPKGQSTFLPTVGLPGNAWRHHSMVRLQDGRFLDPLEGRIFANQAEFEFAYFKHHRDQVTVIVN